MKEGRKEGRINKERVQRKAVVVDSVSFKGANNQKALVSLYWYARTVKSAEMDDRTLDAVGWNLQRVTLHYRRNTQHTHNGRTRQPEAPKETQKEKTKNRV